MGRNADRSKFTKAERALLRELAGKAWKAELGEALAELHGEFGKWADDAIDAFELSDKIHEFHNGKSRELYGIYTALDSATLVSRAVALGLLETGAIGQELLGKLAPEIEFIRERRR